MKDLDICIENGKKFIENNNYNKAEKIFLKTQSQWPKDPRSFIEYAHIADMQNNNEESLFRWKIVKDRFGKNPAVLNDIGNEYLKKGEFKKAENIFKIIQEHRDKDMSNINSLIHKGNEYFVSGNHEKAENIFLYAQSKWPEYIAPFHAYHCILEIKRRSNNST